MLEAGLEAISILLSWPVILFLFVGTLIGLLFGAMPGLGGVVVLTLLLPISVGFGANNTVALFGAALGGVAFGGSISAILLNVPGTAPNAATCLDGYPMSQKGEAGKAIGASAAASGLGAIFGIVILLAMIPIAREVVLSFASPEFFMITMLGIVVIAFITHGEFFKGLVAGGIGLMFTFVGFSPTTGALRYNLIDWLGFETGRLYLYDGIGLVPAVIGTFAISEALHLLIKRRSTISAQNVGSSRSGVWSGIKSVWTHKMVWLQGSLIGTFIGMIPGVGGAVANFIAYLRASQTNVNPENFGQGDVRGVIGPEAANDAKDGGALLPTIAFGIPGSATMAIILGALSLQGIPPGPNLITEEIQIIFVLIGALIFANILTSLLGITFASHIAKITTVPTSYIIPIILVISLTGAYVINQEMGDVILAILIGIMAFFMVLYNYSRIAFIIGLILGRIAEINFSQTSQAYDTGALVIFTRPISLAFFIAIIATLMYPLLSSYLRKRS